MTAERNRLDSFQMKKLITRVRVDYRKSGLSDALFAGVMSKQLGFSITNFNVAFVRRSLSIKATRSSSKPIPPLAPSIDKLAYSILPIIAELEALQLKVKQLQQFHAS